MGKPQRRKKRTTMNKDTHRTLKLKYYTKDIDQIHDDLVPEKAAELSNQPLDEDLPGLGQFYCIPCARYFVDGPALAEHNRGKTHKKRLRELKEPIYTQKDAERAVGLSTERQSKRSGDVEMSMF